MCFLGFNVKAKVFIGGTFLLCKRDLNPWSRQESGILVETVIWDGFYIICASYEHTDH